MTERELDRHAAHRLAIIRHAQELTGNVAKTCRYYLKRYHDIELSPSGIWRILHRLDMSRLPSSQRYRRHRERWKR